MSESEDADKGADDAPQQDSAQAQPARFDEALGELEKLVETLEQGDLSLEDSLSHFERGIGLARECRESLHGAEQQVRMLLERDGAGDDDEGALGTFSPDADDQ
jgi:exodeoxyribonuclease VII small subunit